MTKTTDFPLVNEYGAEGTLLKLIDEIERKTALLPTNTVTESGDAIYDRILPLLEQAHQLAAEWDAEVRRNGLAVGRLSAK